MRHLISLRVFNAFRIQPDPDFLHGRSRRIPLKSFHYQWCHNRINLEMFIFVNRISNRNGSTIKFALQQIFRHSSNHFF